MCKVLLNCLGFFLFFFFQGFEIFAAGRCRQLKTRWWAACTIAQETPAQPVWDHASLHALQGGPGQHGQRGETRHVDAAHKPTESVLTPSQCCNEKPLQYLSSLYYTTLLGWAINQTLFIQQLRMRFTVLFMQLSQKLREKDVKNGFKV